MSFKPGPHSSPITSYRARCRSLNGGVAGSRTGTRSPVTVSGLTTGKTYLCTVTQTTGSGTSPDSSPARATVGAPAPPAVLNHLPLDHGIAFPFVPPADNGRAISEYRSRCVAGNHPARVSPPQPRSPLIAGSLANGQSYLCAVTARNARGVSPRDAVGARHGRPPAGSPRELHGLGRNARGEAGARNLAREAADLDAGVDVLEVHRAVRAGARRCRSRSGRRPRSPAATWSASTAPGRERCAGPRRAAWASRP